MIGIVFSDCGTENCADQKYMSKKSMLMIFSFFFDHMLDDQINHAVTRSPSVVEC